VAFRFFPVRVEVLVVFAFPTVDIFAVHDALPACYYSISLPVCHLPRVFSPALRFGETPLRALVLPCRTFTLRRRADGVLRDGLRVPPFGTFTLRRWRCLLPHLRRPSACVQYLFCPQHAKAPLRVLPYSCVPAPSVPAFACNAFRGGLSPVRVGRYSQLFCALLGVALLLTLVSYSSAAVWSTPGVTRRTFRGAVSGRVTFLLQFMLRTLFTGSFFPTGVRWLPGILPSLTSAITTLLLLRDNSGRDFGDERVLFALVGRCVVDLLPAGIATFCVPVVDYTRQARSRRAAAYLLPSNTTRYLRARLYR